MSFDELSFKRKVSAALERVRRILAVSRSPCLPADVPHAYGDKYLLAESLTRLGLAGWLLCLERCGLTPAICGQLSEWAAERSVTLRLRAVESCSFDRQEERKEESASQHVRETKVLGITKKTTDKVVTTINEWFWTQQVRWELVAFRGNDPQGSGIVLCGRRGGCTIVTTSEVTPRPKSMVHDNMDVNITWLVQQVSREDGLLSFRVDRGHEDCRTPRRNPQVQQALQQLSSLRSWANKVKALFTGQWFPLEAKHGLPLSSINASPVFNPVIPLFEEYGESISLLEDEDATPPAAVAAAAAAADGALVATTLVGSSVADSQASLKVADLNAFLAAERDSLASKLGSMRDEFPPGQEPPTGPGLQGAWGKAVGAGEDASTPPPQAQDPEATSTAGKQEADKQEASSKKASKKKKKGQEEPTAPDRRIITLVEAQLLVVLSHGDVLTEYHRDGVDYIEHMLRQQLESAIGKVVGPAEFHEYMRFHHAKLFRTAYQLQPWSYAVRRPGYTPEGTVSLEVSLGGKAEPILTQVRRRAASQVSQPMSFALGASSLVRFTGDQYVHSWISHQFSGSGSPRLELVARARQFSSFVLMLGRIGGPTLFQPKHAIIVQNKDDLRLPLLLEQMPAAKEFKDAIESLSPEQQRFAKAFRSMQLEGTLFAVCIVQIKPQLERLLKLPANSLTKEIKLTQQLQELLIKYQVPSDLLSWGGPADAAQAAKLQGVKGHVAAMMAMIKEARDKQLAEAEEKVIISTPPALLIPPREPSTESSSESPVLSRKPRKPVPRKRKKKKKRGVFSRLAKALSPRRRKSEVSIDYCMSAPVYSAPADQGMLMCDMEEAAAPAPSRRKSRSKSPKRESKAMAPDRMRRKKKEMDSAPRAKEVAAPPSLSKKSPAPRPSPKSETIASPPVSGAAQPAPSVPEPVASVPEPVASVPEPSPEPAAKKEAEPAPEPEPEPAPEEPQDKQEEQQEAQDSEATGPAEADQQQVVDYTQIPGQLDKQLLALDEDAAVRPTTIKFGPVWQKQFQRALLSDPETSSLREAEQRTELNKAMDLLDALSKSGGLLVEDTELHVVIAGTHCFARSVMDTVIMDNVNPIEKVERTMLIVAEVIQGKQTQELVKPQCMEGLMLTAPMMVQQQDQQMIEEA